MVASLPSSPDMQIARCLAYAGQASGYMTPEQAEASTQALIGLTRAPEPEQTAMQKAIIEAKCSIDSSIFEKVSMLSDPSEVSFVVAGNNVNKGLGGIG